MKWIRPLELFVDVVITLWLFEAIFQPRTMKPQPRVPQAS